VVFAVASQQVHSTLRRADVNRVTSSRVDEEGTDPAKGRLPWRCPPPKRRFPRVGCQLLLAVHLLTGTAAGDCEDRRTCCRPNWCRPRQCELDKVTGPPALSRCCGHLLSGPPWPDTPHQRVRAKESRSFRCCEHLRLTGLDAECRPT
jgi:hypothetical protein